MEAPEASGSAPLYQQLLCHIACGDAIIKCIHDGNSLLVGLALGTGGDAEAPWLELLSDEEENRVKRLAMAHDRRSLAAAHALKRLVLSAVLGEQPECLAFGESESGKPVLQKPGGNKLVFNISHTAGYVAVACSESDIGVDVENTWRSHVDPSLAEMMFGEEIAARMSFRFKGKDWREAFFVEWTRREAVLKAAGVGLARPMSAIAFDGDTARLDGRRWHLRQWELPTGYCLALALMPGCGVADHHLDIPTFSRWCSDALFACPLS